MDRILIAANRLPVTVGATIRKSSGGLASAMRGLRDRFENLWIGWPGSAVIDPQRREALRDELRDEFGCVPVYLSRRQVRDYYQGYANSGLWPLLHYMAHYVRQNNNWWQAYQHVNRQFADTVLEVARPEDYVWVQDYHLMLVPQMLREARPDLRIGFFLHTPFPSYEVFRCHPQRTELLEGLLGADLVGFHTFGYMRHFRSAVLRLLGLESEFDFIRLGSRRCNMGVYPIGIDAEGFAQELASERLRRRREGLREAYQGKRVVLGVERLDYTKGLPRRLEAIDRFLSGWRDKNSIVFILVSVPSRGEVPQYRELREQVEYEIGRINGRHSTVENTPIHFIHKSVAFTDLCALYSIADVAMVTPVMDGMNIVAKEYVACKRDQPGVLILSEFAGAAGELFNALIVNPYDVDSMARSLHQALTMSEQEQRERMDGMRGHVIDFDARAWAGLFLHDLEHRPQQRRTLAITAPDVGAQVVERFANSTRIACFLNYDGTLRELESAPDRALPTGGMHDLFDRLQHEGRVDTYIISGRTHEDLGAWFAPYDFTLIAEHGFAVRLAGQAQWGPLDDTIDVSWKEQVKGIFEQYVGTTPGSFVEEKASAVVWHYRRSDPEFGRWKAEQLVSSLYEMLGNLPAEVHHGKCIVEVSSVQVSKGAAVRHFVADTPYDLVLCAGDDQTDESMFRLRDDRLLSVKVGEGDTEAAYRVDSPEHFRDILNRALDALPGD